MYTHWQANIITAFETCLRVLGVGGDPDKRTTLSSTAFIAVATYMLYLTLRQPRRRRAPGPPRLPVLGNVLQIPRKLQFIQFNEWGKIYGPIYSLDLVGQHVVVLNTFKVAADLLDRCSNIYSSRPRLVMASEILSGGLFMPLAEDNNMFRRSRRVTQEGFSSKAVEKLRSIQRRSTALAALRIISNPQEWEHNLQISAASSIYTSVYDWPVLNTDSPHARLMGDFLAYIASASSPGAFLVDLFPTMKHIPTWMAKWKRDGVAWHEEHSRIFEEIQASAAARMAAGELQDSFAHKLAETEKRHGFSEKESAWLSAVMLVGGTDTTASALTNFILAMLHYPEVVLKAQAELDRVVGRQRAPSFEDQASLPYIRAIAQETLRWRPVGPMGIPHKATEDNWYEGYFIPKGTTVIGNIWAMNHDPSIYPDFDVFRPERFYDPQEDAEIVIPDTHQMGHRTFGFGRRVCAGIHFAKQSLFMGMATLLWAFDIKPCLDEQGNPILPPTDKWVDEGLVVRTPPFPAQLSPRFAEVQSILEAVATPE